MTITTNPTTATPATTAVTDAVPFETSSRRRSASPARRRRRGVVVLAALLVALVGVASPAGAFTVSGSGATGAVSVPPQIYGLTTCSAGFTSSLGFPICTLPQRFVTVSNGVVDEAASYASRDQFVRVTARLFTNSGTRWAHADSRVWEGTIPAASKAINIPRGDFPVVQFSVYSVTYTVEWFVRDSTNNWVRVGTRKVDYHTAQDYRCLAHSVNGTNVTCSVFNTTWGGSGLRWS